MPYRKPTVETIHLDKVECPELWVTFRDPSSLSAADQLAIQKAQFVLMRVNRRQEPPPAEDDWTIRAVHDAVQKLLVDWNLIYPDDHPRAGQMIPLHRPTVKPCGDCGKEPEGEEPDKTKPEIDPEGEDDPLGPLPGEVYRHIVEEVASRLFRPSKRP